MHPRLIGNHYAQIHHSSPPPPSPPLEFASPTPQSKSHFISQSLSSHHPSPFLYYSCSVAELVMAEVDYNRKRSRSPSDSDEKKHHKRANTGAIPSDDSRAQNIQSSRSTAASAVAHDISMSEAPASVADTTASTPSPKASSSDAKAHDARSRSDDNSKFSAITSAALSSSTSGTTPPSAMIHMRCLIVTQDASIIIGRGGAHVNEIRDKSGARVVVSESIPGNPERILNVSGPLDAVSKACPCSLHVLISCLYQPSTRPLVSLYGG